MARPLAWAAASLAVAAIGLPAALTAKAAGRDGIESAKYEVVETFEDFEVRDYKSRIVARVTVTGSAKKASSDGFRILAGYIFGGNTAKASVAMTAPVDRTRSEEIAMTAPVDRQGAGEQWVITFTMPSEYTLETLPTPDDDRIVIEQIARRRFAAVRFSGTSGEAKFDRQAKSLWEAVEAEGLPLTGSRPVYSRFDPPWTLPFLRRNEVLLELTLPPDASDKD